MKIADISAYQGNIDWERARKELEMVIFRASVGMKADTHYPRYAVECYLPYGVYHFVKAGTAEDARKEAEFFVKCAKKGRPLFYIADIEYEAQTRANTEEVAEAFLETLRKNGCEKIGMYIGGEHYEWAGNARNMCDIMWIPRWGKDDGKIPEEKFAPVHYCDLWQYTSAGRVDGINTQVDLNLIRGDKSLEWFTEGYTGKEDDTGMFTDAMLVDYCRKVYEAGWVYWYGTCGYKCSQALYEAKKSQYPDQYQDSRSNGYAKDIEEGRMCADCVGLIKSFFWKGGDIGGANKYASNGCPDTNADGMLALCSEKGDIKTMPDIPGLVVHKKGHIGVYVGGGYTVEMKGFAYDCVMAKVTDGPWTEWGRLPEKMLSYTGVATSVEPAAYELGERTLQKGDVGADVKALQEALMALGYDLPKYGADGDYGKETVAAVTLFQTAHGLEETGVFGAAEYKMLSVSDTGEAEPEVLCILVITGSEASLKEVQKVHGGVICPMNEAEVIMG